MAFGSFRTRDDRILLVVDPGLSCAVAVGVLSEAAEAFDFGGVGVDDPGSSLVLEAGGR
ncbi:hypothetical protein ACIBL5_34270 [Streptomyces sp. NPDC050516]|uniref:hypothetical protein n=1 Tax=Streptomyces sp. NPDC050516 TaxID=3365621 RepID=UPI0037AC0714